MDSRSSGASGASDLSAEQLYDLTRHSKTGSRRPLPFDAYWEERNAKPDKRFLVDSNEFDRQLLKFLALSEKKSVHALARELLREAALRRVMSPAEPKGR